MIDKKYINNKINDWSKQISTLKTIKLMFAEKKDQYWQHPMNDSQKQMSMPWTSKWITSKKEISMLRRSKHEWLLKTNMNANNSKINYCLKQMSMLRKCKLMI